MGRGEYSAPSKPRVAGWTDNIASVDGQCGVHTYPGVTPAIVNTLLKGLAAEGMKASATGQNVWDIDTGQHDVKLRGTWNPSTQTLSVIVTDSSVFATCDKIWSKIDPLLNQIIRGA